MARRPLVSVCMPVRNCAAYLPEAVESVMASAGIDLEVLVHDDASTDETWPTAQSLQSGRVRVFQHGTQVGIPANRNSCLAHARGRYIAWLDGDDRFLPGGLEALVTALETHRDVGLAHGAFEVIAADGRRLPDWPMPFTRDTVERGADAFAELVLMNYITAPVVVRRGCHSSAGPYALDIGPSSTDWEMWLRIALATDLAYVARPLSQYRQHDGSITAATRAGGQRLDCDAAAVARVFSRHRRAIGDADSLESRAKLALLAKAVLAARELVAGGDWAGGYALLQRHAAIAGPLEPETRRLLTELADCNEFAVHERSQRIVGRIRRRLRGTRLAARLRKFASPDRGWRRTLEAIAAVIRELVPSNACVATVDKWDPTLLHLARRAGRHFPDRAQLPGGYPEDSTSAVVHLEGMRRDGVTHLVIPSAAFWWLRHYEAFARHLEERYSTIWRDDQCVIYALREDAA